MSAGAPDGHLHDVLSRMKASRAWNPTVAADFQADLDKAFEAANVEFTTVDHNGQFEAL